MFGKDFQHKYALTDQGVKNTKQGTLFTVVVNLVVMGGMSILYFLMTKFMDTLTTGAPLPNALVFILLVLAFVVLSLITHMQQYRTTYGLVYSEVKAVRISIAERLRKLPLGYFGKRDLADLTETIMGGCEPTGACLVPLPGIFVWIVYFYRDHCCRTFYL